MSVDDLVGLLRGEPGPFLETETSFFGKKRVDPSMKDALMETDCGGMIITKAKMTYGQADELARQVDLAAYPAFVRGLKRNAYWRWERPDAAERYVGEVYWSIYSYLTTYGYVEGDPSRYNNALEYLFGRVLARLVAASVFTVRDREWFLLSEVGSV